MISLQFTERELDVIIDSVVVRYEGLVDSAVFAMNPLAVKLRLKELDKIKDSLRIVRDLNNAKT